MLLTLIKTKETRFGVHAILYETNHIWGDKQLAEDKYISISEQNSCYGKRQSRVF